MRRSRMFTAALAALGLSLCRAGLADDAPPPSASVYGTIISIRGNILAVRPQYRPKIVRVAVGDKTEIVRYVRTDATALKVGSRIETEGPFSAKDGFRPKYLDTAEQAIGYLKHQTKGVEVSKDGGFASCTGVMKSVQPYIFTDDQGKDHPLDVTQLKGIWKDELQPVSTLLIGTRIEASGTASADEVIQASSVMPERGYAEDGTMFATLNGTAKDAQGRTVLTIRPRFTDDAVTVVCEENCTVLRQINLDPDSIKLGTTVTVWGFQHNHDWDKPKSDALDAIGLLLGTKPYPVAASGPGGGVSLTGRLASLDPAALALPDGRRLPILVPGQMIVARLAPQRLEDLTPGSQMLLVLSRQPDGSFHARTIIRDAPPFVGYGN